MNLKKFFVAKLKLLGRDITFQKLPLKVSEFVRMLFAVWIFKKPWVLINAYIHKNGPPTNSYFLHNGMHLYLSNHPHDSITVMVIFCRKEYGVIPKNSIVIDIGANIGIFSLYAIYQGAAKVYSFEPNPNAYKILLKNIIENKLEDCIIPFNLGVSDKDEKRIYLPAESSPYNQATGLKVDDNFIEANTISLSTILKNLIKENIDICKMDCEGAEYEILYTTNDLQFTRISKLRMEHHDFSEKKNLIKRMDRLGFKVVHEQNNILWFDK